MYIDNIKFSNYRNIKTESLELNHNINIFIGDNANGKTNLLEALYLLSITKSFKTNNLSELISFNKDCFFLSANLYKKDLLYIVDFNYINNTKQIKINNNSINKFKDIIGLVNVVLFVPDDLLLIKGSPSKRRNLLDIELSKLYPKYFNALVNYYNILKQRNIHLKDKILDKVVISTYNDLLIKYGSIIYEYRNTLIRDLISLVNDFYNKFTNTSNTIDIKYYSNIKDPNTYLDILNNSYQKDMQFNQTHIGIHRDDLIINLNNKDMSNYASQGEQRSFIIALKFSLVEYIYLKTKEYPILLLDDIMSELDNNRQTNLIKYLNNKVQTFITTTNLDYIEYNQLDNINIYKINNGIIKEAK